MREAILLPKKYHTFTYYARWYLAIGENLFVAITVETLLFQRKGLKVVPLFLSEMDLESQFYKAFVVQLKTLF